MPRLYIYAAGCTTSSRIFLRQFHSSRAVQGFRRLIRPPVDIARLITSKDAPPRFECTAWLEESDQGLQRWVRRADGSVLRQQSITRRDVDLLEDAGVQELRLYATLLQECGNAGALEDGRKVHAHLSKWDLHKDVFVGNYLLGMYGKCGSMKEAREVFDSMPDRNVISWNMMITANARNGDIDQAKLLFDQMPERTLVSWNSLLTAFNLENRMKPLRELFDKMPKWSGVSWTTVMTAYAQKGDLIEATGLFNRMPEPDVVAWTTMIRAHALKGLYRESMVLFRRLNSEGLRPDKVTLLTVLESCDSRLDGVLVHACVLELGFERDITVATALINMYGRCGCLESARKIFVRIEEKDVVAWTSMVNAYSDNGHLEVAKHLLEKMPLKNSTSWNVLITAYARHGYVGEARKMFNALTERDTVTWTLMITAYAQRGHSKKSLDLFRLMIVDGVALDRVTLVCMLYVCGAETALVVGEAIHEYIAGANMHVDATVGTALMIMYGSCGNVEQARRQFDFHLQKDVAFWNAMVQLYGHNGHGKEALQLHTEMVHRGMEWNDITCLNVLSACSHSGLLRQGRDHFLAMERDFGVQPCLEHYISMVDLLARAGKVSDARDLMDNMPFLPNAYAWTTFQAACRAQGKTVGTTGAPELQDYAVAAASSS